MQRRALTHRRWLPQLRAKLRTQLRDPGTPFQLCSARRIDAACGIKGAQAGDTDHRDVDTHVAADQSLVVLNDGAPASSIFVRLGHGDDDPADGIVGLPQDVHFRRGDGGGGIAHHEQDTGVPCLLKCCGNGAFVQPTHAGRIDDRDAVHVRVSYGDLR